MLRSLMLVAALLALTGCAISIPIGGPTKVRATYTPLELAYQAANAVDFSQTVSIARTGDCYAESDNWTTALIGRQPSPADAVKGWAVYSTGHALVSGWLLRKADTSGDDAWHAAYVAWQLVTIGNSVNHIVHNYRDGLTPFGRTDWSRRACNHYLERRGQR
jgi:hypothetical protein